MKAPLESFDKVQRTRRPKTVRLAATEHRAGRVIPHGFHQPLGFVKEIGAPLKGANQGWGQATVSARALGYT